MTNFTKVSTLFQDKNLSLIVNRTDSESVYDIMKFQPKGVLSYTRDKGIQCKELVYTEKVNKFIRAIIEKQPSLVITPEGSIPYDSLSQAIEDETKWPEDYKLWCFCMEGISKKRFKDVVDNYKDDQRLKIVLEDSINYSAHVNSLWYIFRIDKNHLGIVIQLKNNHMSDRNIEHEEDDLTKGNTIYIFDLNGGQPTKNTLLSLICADALHIDVGSNTEGVSQAYPIIINPQCNGKPFNERFKDSRISIFNSRSFSKQRYIVANWAEGTKLNNAFEIKEAGNIYYNYLMVNGHSHFGKICCDIDSYSHRMKSQMLGVEYYGSHKFNIWDFGNTESLVRFFVKKDEVTGLDETLSTDQDPMIKERYEYISSKKSWESIDGKCILDSKNGCDSLYISKNEYLRPIKFDECLKRECKGKCVWLYNDYFFGICFGKKLESELKCDYEISNRALANFDPEGLVKRNRKRELFSTLVHLLEENIIPAELPMFDKNLKFDIDTDAAERGSNNIYNATVINAPNEFMNWKDKKGIFAIIDTDCLDVVELAYDDLSNMTSQDIRDQIVLYYRVNGRYTIYDGPHKNLNISTKNAHFTGSVSSIYKGQMQYE